MNRGVGKHWIVCCPPRPESSKTLLVRVLPHAPSSDFPYASFERDNHAPLPSPASPTSQP